MINVDGIWFFPRTGGNYSRFKNDPLLASSVITCRYGWFFFESLQESSNIYVSRRLGISKRYIFNFNIVPDFNQPPRFG